MLVLDLILIGREFQRFAAVTRKVFPPSVSWLYLGQSIVILSCRWYAPASLPDFSFFADFILEEDILFRIFN